ncbi:MAG: hypothetical protein IPO45_09335 [Saprospiraceae bacterium]|nr:hypothetical protein [Candidatus Brachybacter algidus]
MQQIKNNPYRVIGLLVGATAPQQVRQINRLRQSIEAEVEPDEDFSFPVISKLQRTTETVNAAASKIHLESGKINASLFWFYKGNEIDDDAAFDILKGENGDKEEAQKIWTSAIKGKEITKRNVSCLHNLSTLLLSNAFKGNKIFVKILEDAITLKLKFLESDFSADLVKIATDENNRTNKVELQLIFLKELHSEIEKNEDFSTDRFLTILNNLNFSAKEEFLKGFVQKPIRQIEDEISKTKTKRQADKRDAEIFGKELYENTEASIEQLKNVLDTSDIRYQNIADKLANEILQCGIDFFQEFKDEDFDPSDESMNLFDLASSIAVGNIVSQRCEENTENLQEWIDEKPDRDRQKLIADELTFIGSKLERFQSLSDTISNAKDLIDSCKPKLIEIKKALGSNDEFYLNISSAVVQNAQNMLVQAVNEIIEASNSRSFGVSLSSDKASIQTALDITFKIGSFDMNSTLKSHYKNNLDGIKNLAGQLGISTLSPKEKVQQEKTTAERKLREIQNQTFFQNEINAANNEMSKIKEWQFLRSQADRDSQIRNQENKIRQIKTRSEQEKASQIKLQQKRISDLQVKLQQTEY